MFYTSGWDGSDKFCSNFWDCIYELDGEKIFDLKFERLDVFNPENNNFEKLIEKCKKLIETCTS